MTKPIVGSDDDAVEEKWTLDDPSPNTSGFAGLKVATPKW
jgi:hypothetical protein